MAISSLKDLERHKNEQLHKAKHKVDMARQKLETQKVLAQKVTILQQFIGKSGNYEHCHNIDQERHQDGVVRLALA